MKLNFHYGGLGSYEDGCLSYSGGFVKKGMVVDPDYVTWSMFDDFCKESGVDGLVEQVWYKLPEDGMDSVKSIKIGMVDNEIRQMCIDGMRVGELDVFLEQGIPIPVSYVEEVVEEGEEPEAKESDNEGEESEAEQVDENKGKNVEDHPEEEFLEEVVADSRFENLFDEVRNDRNDGLGDVDVDVAVLQLEYARNDQQERDERDEDDLEFERECRDAEHPEPAVDTDDEWEDFNRT